MRRQVNLSEIDLVQGDITQQNITVIVNAANSSLLGGGGVDGAIHRAGGSAILDECKTLGGCKTGDAKITTGGNLKAHYVIHTVGPVYHGGNDGEAELLASCYRRCLQIASERKIESIAFPSISTGAYRYPVADAANIAISTVIGFLNQNDDVKLVRFVLFDDHTLSAYQAALNAI
ncbi:MAG: O-acetyl-ADP-ribose deacetylase [Candidatus Hinthialibacter antarcticus]|nr:O-acetyl-ADP-ribose deacetylase [Candidatus Hinthialibacter antarcticus]